MLESVDDNRDNTKNNIENDSGVEHGDGERGRRRGLHRSIRPGVPVPTTVLVAEMGDGAMFLQGWQYGSCAYLIAEDTGPLRNALATAFGVGNTGRPA